MYVYSASIKTVTDYLSPIGDPREFLYNRAMIDLNTGMEFTQLDKWLYFYHTEIREPVTAWYLSNGIIHIDPGMNRFIGRSILGENHLSAVLYSGKKIKSTDCISLGKYTEIEIIEYPFPSSWKEVNEFKNYIGKNSEPDRDFWRRTLSRFFTERNVNNHVIKYFDNTFYINQTGDKTVVHNLDKKSNLMALLKNIFSCYI